MYLIDKLVILWWDQIKILGWSKELLWNNSFHHHSRRLNLLVRVLSESILNQFARRRLIEKTLLSTYIDSVAAG